MLTDCLEKIKDIKDLIQKNQFDNQINFQIDGGVKEENLGLCIKAGADNVVMGSAIFNENAERRNTVLHLQNKIRELCEN